jgi:hypothetical protein
MILKNNLYTNIKPSCASKIISLMIFILSCSYKEPKIEKIKCVIEDCHEIPKISVHDAITPKMWRLKFCDRTFVTGKPYNIGDSIEVQVLDYR